MWGSGPSVAEKLPELRKLDTAVIANVLGYTLEDYVEVLPRLEDAEGWRGMSSISPAPTQEGGMQFAAIRPGG